MTRGTTPTYSITVSDIENLDTYSIEVDIKQGGALLRFTNDDVVIDEDTIVVKLTQEQTLLLSTGSAHLQVRGVDANGLAWASNIVSIPVNPILRAGVITYEQ